MTRFNTSFKSNSITSSTTSSTTSLTATPNHLPDEKEAPSGIHRDRLPRPRAWSASDLAVNASRPATTIERIDRFAAALDRTVMLDTSCSREQASEWPLVILGPGGDYSRRYVAREGRLERERNKLSETACNANLGVSTEASALKRRAMTLRDRLAALVSRAWSRFEELAIEIFSVRPGDDAVEAAAGDFSGHLSDDADARVTERFRAGVAHDSCGSACVGAIAHRPGRGFAGTAMNSARTNPTPAEQPLPTDPPATPVPPQIKTALDAPPLPEITHHEELPEVTIEVCAGKPVRDPVAGAVESDAEAASCPASRPCESEAPRVFADDAGARRRARREQGHGVRACRGAYREGRAGSGAEQGTLFVGCA